MSFLVTWEPRLGFCYGTSRGLLYMGLYRVIFVGLPKGAARSLDYIAHTRIT